MTVTAEAYVLESPKTPLVRRPLQIPDPGPTEAIVEVILRSLSHGSGLCGWLCPDKRGRPSFSTRGVGRG